MTEPDEDDGVDIDDFLDAHVEGLRGDLMDSYRQLQDCMEPAVEAIGSEEGAMAELQECIRRVEKVEHVLMSLRTLEELRIALDATVGE
jgi:hypothetical protein